MATVSSLELIVKGILQSNPENAHLIIQDYLVRNNVNDKDLVIYQDCWTRTKLAHQSFGYNIQTIRYDVFAKDFVNELVKANKLVNPLDSFIMTIENDLMYYKKQSTSASDNKIRNSNEIINALNENIKISDSINILMNKSMSNITIQSIDSNPQTLLYINQEKSTMLRLYLQRHKILLIGDFPSNRTLFYPINRIYHGVINVKHGELKQKPASNPSIAETYLIETLSSLSIKNSDQCERRAWIAYQCLMECLLSPKLSIFPIVINTSRDSNNFECSFIFEYPLCRPLVSLLSPTLIVYLYKYPDIVLNWSKQLAAGYLSISLLTHKFTNQSLKLNDIFIRDDGRLILSNISFNEDINDLSMTNQYNANIFIDFIQSFLSTVLGMSQTHTVVFRPIDSDSKVNSKVDTKIDKEITYTVITNHEIKLLIPESRNRQIVIVQNKDKYDEGDNNSSKDMILVNVFSDDNIYSIKSDDNQIIINTLHPGQIIINISIQRTLTDGAIVTIAESLINIVVLDSLLTNSPDLLELISMLQISYHYQTQYLRYSTCFFNCCIEDIPETVIVSNISRLNKSYNDNANNDWNTIVKAIESYH